MYEWHELQHELWRVFVLFMQFCPCVHELTAVRAVVRAVEVSENQPTARTARTARTFWEKDIKEYIYSPDSSAHIDTRAQGVVRM